MGMSIYNNLTAMSALHENNRNEKSLAKMLKRAASGMKINSAGDDASGYAISEKMRVKLRALEQNDRNVKNGASMLRTASGAVQEQTNLLKTIKQKVIDASNDTNTDQDREVIQKEIDHCYSQMADIVYDTEFNGEKILLGNSVAEVVSSWEVLNNAMLADDSDIPGLLADANENTLDGEQGPFATFGKATDKIPYDGYNTKAESPAAWPESSVNNTNGDYMVGGTKGVSNTIDLDLSQYTNFSATSQKPLDNKTFCVNSPNSPYRHYFTLTTKTSNNYREGSTIDISGCGSTDDVANEIKKAIAKDSSLGNVYSVLVSGSKVTLTTKQDGVVTNGNDYNTNGAALAGGTSTASGHDRAPGTGLTIGAFTGGKDAITHTETRTDPADPDLKHYVTVVDVPAVKAKLEIPNISSVAPGSGMTIKDAYYGESYLSFRDDNGGLNYDSASGHYTVGRNYQGNFVISGMHCSMSNGSLVAEVSTGGVSAGNNSSITDGITEDRPAAVTYTATTPLTGITNNKAGADGNTAHWDLDLSAYNASDETMAEDLINKYKGKTFGTNRTAEYEFIDTGSSAGMDGLYKVTTNTIDLNEVRNQVKAGKTVAEAFANVLHGRIGNTEILTAADNTTVNGIRMKATSPGEAGNSQKVSSQTGELRHYTIDWQNWADTQGITDIPAALHEKGIRFYCPTDASQWVNVRFVNGFSDLDAERPASGNANMDIKMTIDLSAVDSVETLVETIDTKLGDYLKNKYQHNLLVTSDPKTGTTTIYDQRRKTVRNNTGYDNQEKGAKIGTGIMDNIIKSNRNIYVNDLVVQHTDKASMNIHVRIPQTSIDQIFGYKEGTRHISEYNVMTKDMRDKLLGIPPDKGILDRGIDYLLDAQTTIGAQMNHMDYADNNIITSHENITSAESVIRDADMAKTMMEYAKSNLLSQGSQSMLAQANQTPQAVLSLLQ